jgi:hypothetical protein
MLCRGTKCHHLVELRALEILCVALILKQNGAPCKVCWMYFAFGSLIDRKCMHVVVELNDFLDPIVSETPLILRIYIN